MSPSKHSSGLTKNVDDDDAIEAQQLATLDSITQSDPGVAAAAAETPSAIANSQVQPTSDPADENRRVARSAGVVSLAVLGSRLLGLVREQVMAAYFGAGFLTDAFNIGFRIPNILRDLFAEGVLSVAFVKTFTDYLHGQGAAAAWRLANLVMTALTLIVGVLVIIGVVFAPQLVALMGHGFTPEKTALAVTLTRIMFPFLLMVALASVAMGVLNTKGHFAVPASASTLFNIGSIIGGLAFAYLLSGGAWAGVAAAGGRDAPPGPGGARAIIGMALGTLIGGVLQFLVQVPSLRRVGFRFHPAIDFRDEGVRRVMRLMAPAVVGTASVQINVLVNTFYASQISAGISWLNFAFRLMQFPIGLFGVAIGTATLPAISRLAAVKDIARFRSTLATSITLVFFLTIPSACGLIVLGRPIIALIYERGHFTTFDTRMVAAALAAYSLGLVGYAALKVLSPAFYALGDARTPMIVSLCSIALNIVTSYFLFHLFAANSSLARLIGADSDINYGHVGLALSTSFVALVNFIALLFLMRRKITRLDGRLIFASLWRVILASLLLSIVCYLSHRALAFYLSDGHFIAGMVKTFVPIALGGAAFLSVARLLRIPELSLALSTVTNRFQSHAG